MKNYLFTSESVSEGHPDKVCDKISDALLDFYLKRDPMARVAIETMATTNFVVVAGEVTCSAIYSQEEIEEVIKNTNDLNKYKEKVKQGIGLFEKAVG